MSTQTITVRFHLEREADRIAWEKIERIHRGKHLSMGRAIIHGLNHPEDDTDESVSAASLTKELADGIMDELRTTLPSFIAGCVAGTTIAPAASGVQSSQNSPTAFQPHGSMESVVDDMQEPDFSRSHANWSFLGG